MGNALKKLRENKGWTHDEAANQMGISRGQFIKLERGERGLTQRTIDLAARAFGVAPAEILEEGRNRADITQVVGSNRGGQRPPPVLLGSRDLKVFAAVEAGSGTMVVSTEPIELVPRPWYLREVKDGFAVLVVGESMEPRYEPGDLAIVNPRLPPMRGKDVILVSGEMEGEFTATIKRLLGWTETEWKLRQYNPRKDFTLPKKEWQKALRVVGKYDGS